MPRKELKKYRLAWDFKNNRGIVLLTATDDSRKKIMVKDPTVFSAISEFLRKEEPIYFYKDLIIATDEEMIGEDE